MRFFARRRWHPLVVVGRSHPLDQRAFVGFSRNDCRIAAQIGGRAVAIIEPKIGFAMFWIRAMTIEAIAREDRADVLVEADLVRYGSRCGRSGSDGENKCRRP